MVVMCVLCDLTCFIVSYYIFIVVKAPRISTISLVLGRSEHAVQDLPRRVLMARTTVHIVELRG